MRSSVNVSMTDLVAALRWVHENIHWFGGNPDNILIFGNSGGGSKVTTLLGMPAAKGLVRRAIVQSGGGGNIPSTDQSREYARQVMRELRIGAKDIATLQKMDWATLNAASSRAAEKINSPDGVQLQDNDVALRSPRAWDGGRRWTGA